MPGASWGPQLTQEGSGQLLLLSPLFWLGGAPPAGPRSSQCLPSHCPTHCREGLSGGFWATLQPPLAIVLQILPLTPRGLEAHYPPKWPHPS